MALEIGQQAPDFSLKSTGEQDKITLSDYKGKNVVLLFFPFAFSSVCTDELCGVSDGFSEFAQLNTDVLAVSVDSPFANQAFADAKNISFPLLSDFNKEVAEKYGVLYDLGDFKGVSKRSAFIIDKNGVIQYAWSSDDPKQVPDFNEIKSELEKLNR